MKETVQTFEDFQLSGMIFSLDIIKYIVVYESTTVNIPLSCLGKINASQITMHHKVTTNGTRVDIDEEIRVKTGKAG